MKYWPQILDEFLDKVRELCKQTVIGKVKTVFGEYSTSFYAEIQSTIYTLNSVNLPIKADFGYGNREHPWSSNLPHWRRDPTHSMAHGGASDEQCGAEGV